MGAKVRGRDDGKVTRREALELIGAAAGIGLLGAYGSMGPIDTLAASVEQKRVVFPKGAIIRTILKDVPPRDLESGATLFHEHLSVDISGIAGGVVSENAPQPPPTPRPARTNPVVKC